MSNLISRAFAARQAQLEAVADEQRAHVEAKRLEVLEHTRNYAFAMFGAPIVDEDITLVPCSDPSHPNVYGTAMFWFEGLLFRFYIWSATWSVMAHQDGKEHGFKDLASLGEVLRHPDFAHLTCNQSEDDDE